MGKKKETPNYEEIILALKDEIALLKSKIGGYSRSNKEYRKKIDELKEEIRLLTLDRDRISSKCEKLEKTPWWKRVFTW